MTSCTFLRCPAPATVTLEPQNGGAPWHACGRHRGRMEKALCLGVAGGIGPDVVKIKRPRE